MYTMRFISDVAKQYKKQNKSSFFQILRPHQWKVIVHTPCYLQGAAFIQKILLFHICTWEKLLLLRMKNIVFDINRNKYYILWWRKYWIYLQGIYVCNSKKCLTGVGKLNINIYMTIYTRLDGVPPAVVQSVVCRNCYCSEVLFYLCIYCTRAVDNTHSLVVIVVIHDIASEIIKCSSKIIELIWELKSYDLCY